LEQIIDVVENESQLNQPRIEYGREIEEELSNLEQLIARDTEISARYSPRWLAVKLLEEDEEIIRKFGE